jgi:hypothetical protein
MTAEIHAAGHAAHYIGGDLEADVADEGGDQQRGQRPG